MNAFRSSLTRVTTIVLTIVCLAWTSLAFGNDCWVELVTKLAKNPKAKEGVEMFGRARRALGADPRASASTLMDFFPDERDLEHLLEGFPRMQADSGFEHFVAEGLESADKARAQASLVRYARNELADGDIMHLEWELDGKRLDIRLRNGNNIEGKANDWSDPFWSDPVTSQFGFNAMLPQSRVFYEDAKRNGKKFILAIDQRMSETVLANFRKSYKEMVDDAEFFELRNGDF